MQVNCLIDKSQAIFCERMDSSVPPGLAHSLLTLQRLAGEDAFSVGLNFALAPSCSAAAGGSGGGAGCRPAGPRPPGGEHEVSEG